MKAKNSNKANAALDPSAIATNRISSRWSNDEYQLAIRGMRKYGKDFQSIAELMGTKTESQVNQFFTNFRKRYNLDDIIKEFDAKQLQEQQLKQKLSEAQQKPLTSSNSTNIAKNSDVKSDLKKPISDDEIMEVSCLQGDGMYNIRRCTFYCVLSSTNVCLMFCLWNECERIYIFIYMLRINFPGNHFTFSNLIF